MITLPQATRPYFLNFSWGIAISMLLALGVATPVSAFDTADAAYPDASSEDAAPQLGKIELLDGSIIYGEVVDLHGDTLTLATSFNSALTIDVSLVKHMYSGAETELLLEDERVLTVPALAVRDGQLALDDGEKIALVAVQAVNPEDWEAGNGYDWTGNSGLALAYNRGNTKTDEFDVAVDTTLRSTRDRIIVRANFEQDFTYNKEQRIDGDVISNIENKQTTADNWQVLTKYDYFLKDVDYYIGTNVNFEADALADIKLRTYVGPYYGRRLVDNSNLSLDAEFGAVYVSTDFVNAEDTNYPGINWNFTGESSIVGGDSRLYLKHVGIIDLDNADAFILNTTVGLAFPLVLGLEAAGEVTLNYDGGAAEGKDQLDQVYKFRIGYGW